MPALGVEGVVWGLCAYASMQTSGNAPCLHLRATPSLRLPPYPEVRPPSSTRFMHFIIAGK